ncbi:S1C family serine protease [Halegenticoccus tardaugens]|uniref:S1C family serine protease n=1 Tax=Halegenticoccus tardaugens TaxID=2071624 RepID=UPI00100B1B6A|nr:trypsin-like peptidase domain-containing protein [Halegenticoccus tardaugens]
MDADSLTRRACLGLLGSAVGVGVAGSPGAAQSTGTDGSADRSVFTRLYRETVGSVVLIRVPGGALGSGFVVDDRHVATNYHVVTDSERVDVGFSRGESSIGDVVGTDAYTDLAAVRVRPPSYAEPLRLAETDPAIGTEVAVIGSPYGLRGSLTTGVVSGVDRLVPSPARGYRIPNAVQTDASVNPGNSGGPLVNLDGTVLGVVSSGGGENVAFAVSAPLARRVVPALVDAGRYRHSYLGVRLTDVTDAVARANDLGRSRGLLVVDVLAGGPAAGALRGSDSTATVGGFSVPTGGDVIVAVDGRRVRSVQDFQSYLALETSPGRRVTLAVLRDGRRRRIRVALGARPPP